MDVRREMRGYMNKVSSEINLEKMLLLVELLDNRKLLESVTEEALER